MVEGERHENALPPGSMLEEYRIEAVLGRGGFGITYLGFDTRLATRVAIKEYFPTDFAHRRADGTVVASATSASEDYAWGLDRFLDEARTLARFRHPNIVSIYRFIEAHGTAYLVMEYLEGDTVAAVIRDRRAELTQADLDALLSALLSGLSAVHAAGILHRDIKPANIAIRGDGTPVLFDFGAARQALGQHSRTMTAVVSYGYSPFEQYSTRGRQGPWTDIYALGAVMYACVSGAPPPDAADRVRNDPYVPAVEVGRGRFSETLLRAIDWALKFDETERPPSIAAWQEAIRGETEVPAAPKGPAVVARDEPPRRWIAAAIVLLAIGLAVGGWAYWDYRAEAERAAAARAADEARTKAEVAARAARARADELARAEAAVAEEARRREEAEAARVRAEEQLARAEAEAAAEARRRDEAEAARVRAEEVARAEAAAAEDARRRGEAEAARRHAEEEARAKAAAAAEARRRAEAEAARKRADEEARAKAEAAQEARRTAEEARAKAEAAEEARARTAADAAARQRAADEAQAKAAAEETQRREQDEAARLKAEQEARAKTAGTDGQKAAQSTKQAALPPAEAASPWTAATTSTYRGELKSPARAAPYRVVTRFVLRKDVLTGSYTYFEEKEQVHGTLDGFRETGTGEGTFRWRDRYGEGTLRVRFGTDMTSFQADWDVSGHPGVSGTWSGRR